ncbi:hypothetical protein BJ970_007429 [Saccharopolyspora phatthalungensis]|uniref:Uncharacterized protein n=1 Tax=Saccharopolyspora phatthalungensis TaxID=664693 RepID=A0A840QK90_9PSEU|nr:hypothetical protein [Saccharopolyspora phatthalungensis]
MNTPDITATRRHTPAVMIVLFGLGAFSTEQPTAMKRRAFG